MQTLLFRKITWFLICWSMLLLQSTNGQTSMATQKLLQDEQLINGRLGIAIIDLNTGKTIEALESTKSFIPASLLKVPTTAAAISLLGHSYYYTTNLGYQGRIINDTLFGNIIIKGNGDPSLGAGREDIPETKEILQLWASKIKELNIKYVKGNIICYTNQPNGNMPSSYWQWNDIGNYYGAGYSTLNINENQYTLYLKKQPIVGQRPTIIEVKPQPLSIKWINELTSAGPRSGDQSYIFGSPGSYIRRITGTIPKGKGIFDVEGSLPNPAQQLADWFADELNTQGIKISGNNVAKLEPTSNIDILPIYNSKSPNLSKLVELTNSYSLNLYAEGLFQTLGEKWETSPEETGERFISYWESRGININGWEQVDGSGLSMRNLITPMALAKVLQKSYSSGFDKLLPVVGKQGTVKWFGKAAAKHGVIRAKSGTLKRAKGYCGYIETDQGKKLAFVIIANNYKGSGSKLSRKMGNWLESIIIEY